MTETSASRHWCPFSRVPNFDTSVNRGHAGIVLDGARCIASRCMAWRWGDDLPAYRRVFSRETRSTSAGSPEPPRPDSLPASWRWVGDDEEMEYGYWVESDEDANARRRGYCGLAGKP